MAKLFSVWRDLTPLLATENHYRKLVKQFQLKKEVLRCFTELKKYYLFKIDRREKVN
jgi:hypothetical protein